MTKINLIVGTIAVIILLAAGFTSGWFAHKRFKPCPEITSDTTIVTDPYWHHIADSLANLPPVEKIKWLPQDTIKLPGDTIKLPVDSTIIKEMLKDYLATYKFSHTFPNNDTLDAIVNVITKKNHPIWYGLDYKFKIPFTTTVNNIDNSITYNSYLQFGLDIPIYNYGVETDKFNNFNNLGVELTYSFPKGYIGGTWGPGNNIVGARFGTTLFKFKKKR